MEEARERAVSAWHETGSGQCAGAEIHHDQRTGRREIGSLVLLGLRGQDDAEERSFAQMKQYIHDHQLEIATLVHREIYISDARKTDPSKLKTVLRYKV